MSLNSLTNSEVGNASQSDGFTNENLSPDVTEQQLRQLYDDEEIERFLHLFSAYVTEVRLPGSPLNSKQLAPQAQVLVDDPENNFSPNPPDPRTLDPPLNIDNVDLNQSLSEIIALQYLLPILPPARPDSPTFTLGRFRLTSQRLYLAIQPVYGPFFIRLANLALWKDKRTSLAYCIMFWIIWYQNLLLPSLCLRILYSLLRRKLFPYPTYRELQEHRNEIDRADEFSEQMSTGFSASSSGIREIWRIVKVFNQATKSKAKNATNGKKREKGLASSSSGNGHKPPPEVEGTLMSDDTEDDQNVKDLKNIGIHILNELADLHERIKNIFIWRRPSSSRTYAVVLFFSFAVSLLLPAKYIAKLTYLLGGIIFWHATPILAALPPTGRARLPPAFSDVPTDADYAMELIAKRLAAGLDVKPSSSRQNKYSPLNSVQPGLKYDLKELRQRSKDGERSVDWKKWGELAAIGKSWAGDGRNLTDGHQNQNLPRLSQQPTVPQGSAIIDKSNNPVENHTYPAQHTSAPGLITITPMAFIFTPLTSMNPKFHIPLNTLRGVKKAGLLKGLHIRYTDAPDSAEEAEKEEKFLWVGARDELFARLVGSEGRRWLKV